MGELHERELHEGDRLRVRFGPYVAVCEVVTITEHGAVIDYASTAELDTAGFPPITAPAGHELAPAGFGFIGRAHWNAQVIVD